MTVAADAVPLLRVEGLGVSYAAPVVEDLSFTVAPRRIVGIAGESGCGKTQLLLALLGLLPAAARVSGNAWLQGEALMGIAPQRLRQLRGNRIAMVFQDPMTALHPQLRVGEQLAEVLRCHRGASRSVARDTALAQLEAVGLDQPLRRYRQYPHELSGGMRQRAVIAMALMCDPAVLLADEPTTALDVTVQAQVLDLLLDLRERRGMGIVLITHDLGVMARVADDLLVMEQGRVVERGEALAVFDAPQAPATRRLLQAARAMEFSPGPAHG